MAYTFRNGYMPASLRVAIGGVTLERRAAYWFRRAIADANRNNRTLGIALPAGGYRSYAVQVDMRANPQKYNLNPDNVTGLAQPGYSGHGFGDRVDVVGTGTSWFLANAAKYGFSREFGARDPNHYRHNGKAIPVSPTTPTAPRPLEEGDDDMKASMIYYNGLNSKKKPIRIYAIYVPGTAYFLPFATNDSAIANGLASSTGSGSAVKVTASMYARVKASAEALLPSGRMIVEMSKTEVDDADGDGNPDTP